MADKNGYNFVIARLGGMHSDLQRVKGEHTGWQIKELRRLGYTELDMFTTTKEQFEEFYKTVAAARARLVELLQDKMPEWYDAENDLVLEFGQRAVRPCKMHKIQLEKLLLELEDD